MKSLFFFLISFTLIGSITGQTDSPQQQHPPDNGSIVLTSRNFDSSISDGSVWLVEFYADWCGHCKRFAPTYEVSIFRVIPSLGGFRFHTIFHILLDNFEITFNILAFL